MNAGAKGDTTGLSTQACIPVPQRRGVRFAARLTAALLCSAIPAGAVHAQSDVLAGATATGDTLRRDSFQIGSNEGVLCRVQSDLTDPALGTIFDRSWTILCRDAAQPVGKIYALRGHDGLARLNARANAPSCGATTITGTRQEAACANYLGNLPGIRLTQQSGRNQIIADGLTVYGDAVRLAMDSIIAGRVVEGRIDVATTSIGDSSALARVQAANLPIDRALAEGYRRNNSGDFAEAQVFFEALQQRNSNERAGVDPTEFMLNRALQHSNLGDFGAAERLFATVDGIPTADPVQLRLRRNFRAMHQLNQRDGEGAMITLNAPIAPVALAATDSSGRPIITDAVAIGLNSGAEARTIAQLAGSERLTTEERAIIIDAQADQLRGTIMRMSGDTDGARQALNRALARSITVRDGRVTSIIRLQAQIMGESALVHETRNDLGAAESDLRAAITLLEREYPETMALAAARSKLAAFLARHNRNDAALTTYREVISGLVAARRQLSGVYNQMAPYFTMLVDNQTRDPAAAAEFFAATQLLVRPGVADTQAQLARELAAGDSEAAGLFRQTNNLTRDIERARIELARLSALGDGEGVVALRTETAARIANYGQQQTEMLSRLSAFPQYRAVSQDSISLSELQATLRPDEGYLKLSLVADAIYGILVTRDGAQAWRSSMTRGELDNAVDRLRQTISALDGGEYTTYPFDAEASAELYAKLFDDVAPRLPGIRHLVFEPDGAMLRLPIGLLIVDPASVASYRARVNAGGDPFDMRGVAWLAKTSRSSTSVSPVAFRNTRNSPASRAGNAYAGFGSNTPPSTAIFAARTAGGATADSGCAWSFDTWNHPIAAAELQNAQRLLGQQGTEIVTGNGFTDQAIMGMGDLNNYRILHFATHGLVTPPRPECVVKPALLTSFGDAQSDGLLSFDEIFALRLDADLVILSACDTAGQASIAATRAAGVTTGGGSALDGLVRAFIGAGSRSVLASHWPAPDDYNATGRLISSLFEATAGTSIADALGAAQDSLIAEADTSHPYYWAGFAIVGAGGQQLHRTGQAAPVAAATPVAPTAAASAGE